MNLCYCCDSSNWANSHQDTTVSDLPEASLKTNVTQKLNGTPGKVQVGDTKVPDYVRVLMVTDLNGRKKQMLIPASLDLERPKRPRTTFTENQLKILEGEFTASHFISESKRQKLSASLGLSETQIKVWFQNRRTKYRRAGKYPDSTVNVHESSRPVNTNGLQPTYETTFSWQPCPFPYTPFSTPVVPGKSPAK
ncbi:unnamed protein product [Allacma fusca]|uniref:Homeobox domain-containing protein n=1 Tax=Allacma fusca TaxID=39272 RepID=A0A8J2NRY5_9HEXA|nr:unnamed protein product [Allacma fusca]